jgi:hypothetical protein
LVCRAGLDILEKIKVLCSLVTISTLYVYLYPCVHGTKDNIKTYLTDLKSYDTEEKKEPTDDTSKDVYSL